MIFESFVMEFGLPKQGTKSDLALLRLEHSQDLRKFVDEVGGGVFADGLISLISERENIENLGGWEQWLPINSRLFGCSAFGLLMTTCGEDLWIVDTQYGQVVESDLTLAEFICELANPATRDEIVLAPLFHSWNQIVGALPTSSVLCPTPVLALGGHWSVDTLSIMTLPVYLSLTGQLFSPTGGMPAEVRTLG